MNKEGLDELKKIFEKNKKKAEIKEKEKEKAKEKIKQTEKIEKEKPEFSQVKPNFDEIIRERNNMIN